MTAAAREHRAAANWRPQQQPWADPLSGLWWAAFRLGDSAATIEALQEAAIAFCERGPHRLRPGRQGG